MVEDWRQDYNHRRPHSSLGMMAPANFARGWPEGRENGQPITLGTTAQGRRSPQDAPLSGTAGEIGPNRRLEAARAARAVSLRSPSGLAPRDRDPLPTMEPLTDHRLSLQVDR